MGDLSEHFSKSEFACKCCGKVMVDKRLVPALEELRALAGGKPIKLNSGYRCPHHNREVGGAKNSCHMRGMAADMNIQGLSPRQSKALAEKVKAFRNGGIGLYPSWIHVDVGSRRRW